VRKQIYQTSMVSQGMGIGVDISEIRRAADSYLQGASLLATAESGRSTALYTGLNNAQLLFGDPSNGATFFDTMDDIWSSFSAAAEDPTSTLSRTQAIGSMNAFLSQSANIASGLQTLTQNADIELTAKTARVNDLLNQVQQLNVDILRAESSGTDSTGSQNIQSNLLDQLSGLVNINVSQRESGGVNVRSTEGYMLVGDGAAQLTYNGSVGADAYISAVLPLGSGQPVRITIKSGEVKGLLELRNTQLPAMADQLGEITAKTVDEINRAANGASTVPAPTTLIGRNTGLAQNEALSGFSGKTNLVVLDSAGLITRQVTVDFDNNTLSLDGGVTTTPFTSGPTAASPNDLISQLNTANGLGGAGSASFSGGKLSLTATVAGTGIAVADDPTTPSDKTGKGFSHYFGLNDIVRGQGMATYATGMTTSSLHGVTAGSITLRLMGEDGSRLRDVTVTPPQPAVGPPVVNGDMQDMLTALNSTTSGVGGFGSFGLDSDGELTFTANAGSGVTYSVVTDTTVRGTTGASVSQLFGLGNVERAARAQRFTVDSSIRATPGKMPFAQVNLSPGAGNPAIVAGDGRGALAISKAIDNTAKFAATGGLPAMNATLARFAAEMSGDIARKASDSESRKDSADAVKTEAVTQRSSVEGVNLDEELVNMTTYQQAYNASARLIQAAKDMYEVLTQIV
jgi:flagellar hook-associated protein 1 FlgK